MPKSTELNISFLNPYEIISEFKLGVGMNVADFGSGAGHFSMAMARAVGDSGKVYAIDVRQSVLQVLEGHIKLDGLFQVKTIHSNLEKENGSTLQAQSQDKVLCANILHQTDHPQNVIKEAYRVLKPGGELIAMDWKKGVPFGPSERMPAEKIQQLAQQAGFKLKEEIKTTESHWVFIFKK